MSKTARDLVARLLIRDHLNRATVHNALQSRWIIEDLDELEQAYRERIG